jgi:hypothetical protein
MGRRNPSALEPSSARGTYFTTNKSEHKQIQDNLQYVGTYFTNFTTCTQVYSGKYLNIKKQAEKPTLKFT